MDIGPEAGEAGGKLVASGTPEQVARHKVSRIAPFLQRTLFPDPASSPEPGEEVATTNPRAATPRRRLTSPAAGPSRVRG